MLDALGQVIHLRAYAQRKPIDEYKHEAFQLFERMLAAIREDVTGRLGRMRFTIQPPEDDFPEMQGLPDFITQHLDPFSGDDDSEDLDAAMRMGALPPDFPPLNVPPRANWRRSGRLRRSSNAMQGFGGHAKRRRPPGRLATSMSERAGASRAPENRIGRRQEAGHIALRTRP